MHLLEVEEENRTMSKTVFSHPAGEVWDLAASPSGERWGRGISFIRSYLMQKFGFLESMQGVNTRQVSTSHVGWT